jgi:predicted Zn-ribbon and HTH transcriptional regulator
VLSYSGRRSSFGHFALSGHPSFAVLSATVLFHVDKSKLARSAIALTGDLRWAGIHFDVILDRVTDSDPSATDYILEQPAKCPSCRCEIFEKTLIEPARCPPERSWTSLVMYAPLPAKIVAEVSHW